MLDHPEGMWRVQDYPLGPLLGQCCGGRVRLLVERVDPAALDWLHDAEPGRMLATTLRSEEYTSELQSLMRSSYAVFCLKNNSNDVVANTNQVFVKHVDGKRINSVISVESRNPSTT